mgnify:CR=1 FL=1
MAANVFGVPFYSVCETAKANALSYGGKSVDVKDGFDRVSSQLIMGIITEKGIIGANEIAELMKEKAKYLEVFQPE